jgi:hypothetical protein
MADYYPLLAKAIAGLPDSTAEARNAIYERARKALFGQLRNLDPPVPEEAIEREAQALERAVAQLETEMTSPSVPDSGAGLAAPNPNRAGSSPPAPPDADSRGVAPPPKRTVLPARPRPAPPLKVREPPGAGLAAPPAEAPPPSGPDVAPAVRSRSPSNVTATRDQSFPPDAGTASSGQATSPKPDLQPSASDVSGGETPVVNAPPFEILASEESSPSLDSDESAARTPIEAQHPFAPRPEGDRGATKRIGIVIGIVGLVVAIVAVAAYKLRDRPEDLVRLSPATVQGEAGPGGKIVDRINAGTATPGAPPASAGMPSSTADRNDVAKSGSAPVNPPLQVARRAALLVEAPEEQSKVKTILGTVVWRVDNVSNGPDEPLSMAVSAEADIAEEGLQAVMTIQKNFDSTLPASHTVKLRFSVRPDSPFAKIKQVSISLRREDTPTGDPLKGITVPVTENSFLIGLSRGDGEAANLDLLRFREWFDIPMVLADGHIAKLTFEKGQSGRSALDDAMASWQAQ